VGRVRPHHFTTPDGKSEIPVLRGAKITNPECPNGHGPMILYPSDVEDDTDDFYECPECGFREVIHGQRSAKSEDS
jgi:predicted RNA-binding Zn-ribbon protein involved in translation (DUF1610 family)